MFSYLADPYAPPKHHLGGSYTPPPPVPYRPPPPTSYPSTTYGPPLSPYKEAEYSQDNYLPTLHHNYHEENYNDHQHLNEVIKEYYNPPPISPDLPTLYYDDLGQIKHMPKPKLPGLVAHNPHGHDPHAPPKSVKGLKTYDPRNHKHHYKHAGTNVMHFGSDFAPPPVHNPHINGYKVSTLAPHVPPFIKNIFHSSTHKPAHGHGSTTPYPLWNKSTTPKPSYYGSTTPYSKVKYSTPKPTTVKSIVINKSTYAPKIHPNPYAYSPTASPSTTLSSLHVPSAYGTATPHGKKEHLTALPTNIEYSTTHPHKDAKSYSIFNFYTTPEPVYVPEKHDYKHVEPYHPPPLIKEIHGSPPPQKDHYHEPHPEVHHKPYHPPKLDAVHIVTPESHHYDPYHHKPHLTTTIKPPALYHSTTIKPYHSPAITLSHSTTHLPHHKHSTTLAPHYEKHHTPDLPIHPYESPHPPELPGVSHNPYHDIMTHPPPDPHHDYTHDLVHHKPGHHEHHEPVHHKPVHHEPPYHPKPTPQHYGPPSHHDEHYPPPAHHKDPHHHKPVHHEPPYHPKPTPTPQHYGPPNHHDEHHPPPAHHKDPHHHPLPNFPHGPPSPPGSHPHPPDYHNKDPYHHNKPPVHHYDDYNLPHVDHLHLYHKPAHDHPHHPSHPPHDYHPPKGKPPAYGYHYHPKHYSVPDSSVSHLPQQDKSYLPVGFHSIYNGPGVPPKYPPVPLGEPPSYPPRPYLLGLNRTEEKIEKIKIDDIDALKEALKKAGIGPGSKKKVYLVKEKNGETHVQISLPVQELFEDSEEFDDRSSEALDLSSLGRSGLETTTKTTTTKRTTTTEPTTTTSTTTRDANLVQLLGPQTTTESNGRRPEKLMKFEMNDFWLQMQKLFKPGQILIKDGNKGTKLKNILISKQKDGDYDEDYEEDYEDNAYDYSDYEEDYEEEDKSKLKMSLKQVPANQLDLRDLLNQVNSDQQNNQLPIQSQDPINVIVVGNANTFRQRQQPLQNNNVMFPDNPRRPGKVQGLTPPIPGSGFRQPDNTQGLRAPIPGSGVRQPDNTQGFRAPFPGSGFRQPDNTQGLRSPLPGSGFRQPDNTQGFSAPIPGSGFRQPDNNNGLVVPNQQFFQNQLNQLNANPTSRIDSAENEELIETSGPSDTRPSESNLLIVTPQPQTTRTSTHPTTTTESEAKKVLESLRSTLNGLVNSVDGLNHTVAVSMEEKSKEIMKEEPSEQVRAMQIEIASLTKMVHDLRLHNQQKQNQGFMSLITQTQNMLKRQEENEQKEKARPTFVTPSTIQVTTTRSTTTTTRTTTTTTASTTTYNWFTSVPTQRPFPLQAIQSVTVQGSQSQSNNIDTGLLSNINQVKNTFVHMILHS